MLLIIIERTNYTGVVDAFHFPTAATPAPQVTSDPHKDLSVLRTENNESHLKEPSSTGGAEQSISQDVAEEAVIRPLSGSCF